MRPADRGHASSRGAYVVEQRPHGVGATERDERLGDHGAVVGETTSIGRSAQGKAFERLIEHVIGGLVRFRPIARGSTAPHRRERASGSGTDEKGPPGQGTVPPEHASESTSGPWTAHADAGRPHPAAHSAVDVAALHDAMLRPRENAA